VTQRYDLVIIGMGSAGLTGAQFAARLGLRTAVVERHRVGGDCLWTGCVPSKALVAAAKVAHHIRTAERYGITAAEPLIDLAAVWQHVRDVQHQIAESDDNAEHYRDLGVDVVLGDALVVGPHSVQVGDRILETRFILIATGSRPAAADVPGMAEARPLTSETLFELESPPASLAIVGGGPIAVEMAQACRRLGMAVALLQKPDHLLPRDEPELVGRVTRVLVDEGVDISTGVVTERVTVEGSTKTIHGTERGAPRSWTAADLLVAVGRTPNVAGLGLSDVGVATGPRGIVVDEFLRTSVPSIYACGDVAGRHLFTHAAAYEAVRAIRTMFFPGKGRADALVPWCTFTDPELAHAGLTPDEAIARHGADDVEVWRHDLEHSDRARADRADVGGVVLVSAKGRLVGAHVLAPAAGEMIHELVLAMSQGMKIGDLAGLVHVYPTYSTSVGILAGEGAFAKADRYRWLIRTGR
jgi:pyruvate/2-oxoglutarate dehydrogenase complex dihydrolipoamide dehydrogenase (E3) component